MLQRVEGWESRLHAHISRHRALPFGWGSNDCVTFAAGAVAALDPSWCWAVAWKDEREALRQLAEMGGLEAATRSVLGRPADDWKACRRGDIALICKAGMPSLAVDAGAKLCGPNLAGGLGFVSRRDVIKVWRVG